MLLKYLLFVYIAIAAALDWKRRTWVESLWKLIFKIQGRVLCFFLTSFWVRMILASTNEGFRMFGMSSDANIILASIMFGLEYVFSLMLETQFYYVLPTKSFLCSKNNYSLLITLFQKAIIQALQICFRSNPDSLRSAWVYDTLNLVFSSIRCYEYFTILPLYNIQALIFQGHLVSLVASLNISCFFRTLLQAVNQDRADINFTIIVWIVLSLLAVKISGGLLRRTINTLLLRQKLDSPAFIMHKLILIKQLRNAEVLPGQFTEKYDLRYLLTAATGISSTKQNEREINLQQLEELSARFPKDEFVKLYISYICSKDRTLYPRAIRFTLELSKMKWSTCHLTALVLLYKIRNMIIDNYGNMKDRLDLFGSIKSHIFVEELRSEMLKQTELKMRICKNIIEDTSDIGEIFNCAQLISRSKARIQNKINFQLQNIPVSFVEPLRLYAEYSLMLNYSVEDYEKYYDLCLQRNAKCAKHFRNVQLTKDNLYQSTNAFLIVKGHKADNGRILFCTKQIQNLCGGDKALYFGSHVSNLFTPCLQSYYTEFFKEVLEAGKNALLHKVTKAYLYHKDKYIVEAEFYLRVHPYVNEYYDLNMLIRPVPSTKEYILIKEDGDIEGASKVLSKSLGIKTALQSSSAKSVNVRTLSEELEKVNKAFNIVHKAKIIPNLTLAANEKQASNKSAQSSNHEFSITMNNGKALELYNAYNSTGRVIEIFPLSNSLGSCSQGYFYHCTVSILTYGSTFLKLLALEPANKEAAHEIETGVNQRHKHRGSLVYDYEIEENLNDSDIHKESENIDCEEKEAGDELRVEWRQDTQLNTDVRLLTSPRSPLLAPITSKLVPSVVLHSPALISHIHSMATFIEPPKDQIEKKKQIYSHVSSQGSSGNTTERNFNRAIQSATNTKTYPRYFSGICLIVYAFITITFFGQVALKTRTDVTMKELMQKNDMLKYAQNRLYREIALQIASSGTGLQITGAMTTGNLGGIGLEIDNTMELMNDHIKELTFAHHKIIEGLAGIDDKTREVLFAKDIRLNGSYFDSQDKTYKLVTDFQFVEDIITSVRILYSMPNRSTYEGLQVVNYIAQNVLGDFLSKELVITDLFLDFVSQGRQDLEYIILLCLIIPLSFAIIALTLILIIWHVYNTERSYILGFIKLNSTRVRDINSDLKDYKRNLINEEYFDKKELTHFARKLDISPQEYEEGKLRKTSISKTVNSSKTRKRYYGHVIKVIFYSALVIAIMTWNFIAAQSSTTTIYRRQSQSDFNNYIGIRAPLYFAAFVSLFSSNNTEYVQGILPLEFFYSALDEIKNTLTRIPEGFAEEDGSYDPRIKAFVFDNTGCQRFSGRHYDYCISLASNDQPTNLLSLVSRYDILLNRKLDDYYRVINTTRNTIRATAYVNIAGLLSSYDLITTDVLSISPIIEENLSKSINDAYDQRVLILFISSFSIAIAGALFWFRVLIKLREVNNDFKKVIQVYPPNLIRSSFLLKKFLRNASDLAPTI